MCRCLSSTYLFEKGKLDVVIKFENNYAEKVELYIVLVPSTYLHTIRYYLFMYLGLNFQNEALNSFFM